MSRSLQDRPTDDQAMVSSPAVPPRWTTAAPFDPSQAWRLIMEGQHAALELKAKQLKQLETQLEERTPCLRMPWQPQGHTSHP